MELSFNCEHRPQWAARQLKGTPVAMGDHEQIQVLAGGKFVLPLEPAHVTFRVGCAYTGDSRSAMYDAIAEGKVEAVKEGNRTLLVFESLKRRAGGS